MSERDQLIKDLDQATRLGDDELATVISNKLTEMESNKQVIGNMKEDNSPLAFGMSLNSKIPEKLRPLGRMATESIGGLGALGYDLLSMPARAAFQDEKDYSRFPASTAVSDFSKGAFHSSKDVPYVAPLSMAGGIVSGAGFGAATKAIGPVRGALSGAGGYLGGAVGGQAAEAAGLPRQLGVIPGSIIGGLPTLLPGGGTAASLAKESLKGRSPSEIQRAISLQQQNPWLRPNQLFDDGAEPLRNLESRILSSNVGEGGLERRILDVPSRSKGVATNAVNKVADVVDDDLYRANQIEGAIEKSLDYPRKFANEQVKHIYDELRDKRPELPMDKAFDLANDLTNLAEKAGVLPSSDAGKAATKAASQATVQSVLLDPAGKNFKYANRDIVGMDKLLGEIQKKVDSSYGLGASGADRTKAVGLKFAADPIENAVLNSSKPLEYAKKEIARIRGALTEEVRSTGIARAAPTKNLEGVLKPNARWEQFKPILEEGAPVDIARARSILDRHDKKAFSDIASQFIRQKLDDAYSKAGDSGGGALFSQMMKEQKNKDAIILEAAKARGVGNPQQVVNGFNSALAALEASGRKVAAPGTQDINSILGLNPAGIVGRFLVGNQLSRSAQAVGAVTSGVSKRQYSKLYEALNNDNSMKILADMAKEPIVSPRFASLMSSLIGGQWSLANESRESKKVKEQQQ